MLDFAAWAARRAAQPARRFTPTRELFILRTILAALGKIGILGLILIAFAFGLAGTVYLSLRSPNVSVPDVTSKTYGEGESSLETAGLTIRERARRFKSGVAPGVILDQFPRAGAVVKQGQTVAVIVSRAPKEGESVTSDEIVEEPKEERPTSPQNQNQNRAPRKPSNKNSNRNSNAQGGNTAGNSNAAGGAGNSNKDSNKNGAAGGANDTRPKNTNGGRPPAPGGARSNSNRRPTTNP